MNDLFNIPMQQAIDEALIIQNHLRYNYVTPTLHQKIKKIQHNFNMLPIPNKRIQPIKETGTIDVM